jgi:hypothetical protein
MQAPKRIPPIGALVEARDTLARGRDCASETLAAEFGCGAAEAPMASNTRLSLRGAVEDDVHSLLPPERRLLLLLRFAL